MKDDKKWNKQLLNVEVVIGVASVSAFIAMCFIAAFVEMQYEIRLAIIIISMVYLVVIAFALLKMEQIVGYYECEKCHHKYVPSYKSIFWAMHIGRTRYMTCPKCHKKSWQKKVL